MTANKKFELVTNDGVVEHESLASARAAARRLDPSARAVIRGPGLPARGILALHAQQGGTVPAAESYAGEARDSALMLARLDYSQSEIEAHIAFNFPTLSDDDVDELVANVIAAVEAHNAAE